MILSDFHPLRKCFVEGFAAKTQANYFDKELHNGDVAYKQFFDEQEQQYFPDVSIRAYTLSEIINSIITAGFTLKRFDEYRGWKNENIPWEFTTLSIKPKP